MVCFGLDSSRRMSIVKGSRGCELPGNLGVALWGNPKQSPGSLGLRLPICKWGFGAVLFSLGVTGPQEQLHWQS